MILTANVHFIARRDSFALDLNLAHSCFRARRFQGTLHFTVQTLWFYLDIIT